MSITYTDNYHLGMQKDHADKFSMNVITGNMEIIDQVLSEKANADIVPSLPAATLLIQTDDDLNEYIEDGQYSSSGADISTILNVPDVIHDFELIVKHTISAYHGIQIHISSTADICIRGFTYDAEQEQTVFGSWKKITTEAVV